MAPLAPVPPLESYILPMPKDGNCFFSAIAKALFNSINEAGKIRIMITRFIVDNWEKYAPFLITSNGLNFKQPQEYLSIASLKSYFASSVEIQAAADLFNICIIIHKNSDEHTFGNPAFKTVTLQHSGSLDSGHFDLLFRNPRKASNIPKIINPSVPAQHPKSKEKSNKQSVQRDSDFLFPRKTITARKTLVPSVVEVQNKFDILKNLEAPEELEAPVHETQQNLQALNKVKLPLWSVQPSARSPSLVKIPLKIGNLNCVALLNRLSLHPCPEWPVEILPHLMLPGCKIYSPQNKL